MFHIKKLKENKSSLIIKLPVERVKLWQHKCLPGKHKVLSWIPDTPYCAGPGNPSMLA